MKGRKTWLLLFIIIEDSFDKGVVCELSTNHVGNRLFIPVLAGRRSSQILKSQSQFPEFLRYPGPQPLRRPPVLILELFSLPESLALNGSDAENAKRQRGEKNRQQKNDDQFLLPFERYLEVFEHFSRRAERSPRFLYYPESNG